MAEVRAITSLEDLEALRLPWNALWMNSQRRELSHSFDWFWEHWPLFQRGRRLQVLAVTSNRRTIGILPLAIRTHGLLRYRTMEFALHEESDSVGVVGPDVTATYVAAMGYLTRQLRHWNRLAFGPFHDPREMTRCRTAIQFSGLTMEKLGDGTNWLGARR